MASKSLLQRGFKAKAERLGEMYREQMRISKFAPLDAFNLADYLQIPVVDLETFKTLPDQHLARLKDPSQFSAMWMPNVEGDKIILHNQYHSGKRQQSNIMHELAHIIRGHEIPEEAAKLCFLFGLHYFNEEQEQEAKYLGACLQITRPGLLWALKQGMNEDQISEYYNASTDMVRFRINATGVLKQRGYGNKKSA